MNSIEKDSYLREKFAGKLVSELEYCNEEKNKLVVFDFDETLVQSKDMFFNANKRAMEILNLPHNDYIVSNIFILVNSEYLGWGKDLKEQVEIYENLYAPLVTKLSNTEEFLNQVKFYNVMHSVIKELAKMNIALAVASSRDLYSILSVLKREGLKDYFDIIEATEGGKIFRDKPDTHIVQYISQEVGVPLEKAVMVGDSKCDIDMGKSAGMKTIGIGFGAFTSLEKMESCRPNVLLGCKEELKDIPVHIKYLLNQKSK